MDKLELLQRYDSSNHFGKLIGMQITAFSPGHVEYTMTMKQEHMATPRAVHGGVIAALMDAVLGVTALSAVYMDNKVVSTVEYKTHFLSPAFLHDELKGTAKIEQQGNRLLIVSGEIVCTSRNVTIAKAIGTFNAYPAEKAGY